LEESKITQSSKAKYSKKNIQFEMTREYKII
jgi:hypothetical protein